MTGWTTDYAETFLPSDEMRTFALLDFDRLQQHQIKHILETHTKKGSLSITGIYTGQFLIV